MHTVMIEGRSHAVFSARGNPRHFSVTLVHQPRALRLSIASRFPILFLLSILKLYKKIHLIQWIASNNKHIHSLSMLTIINAQRCF
jgi:hypothetical protein